MGALLVSGLLNMGLRALVERPRPAEELLRVFPPDLGGSSFPSGHVMHYVVFLGTIAFILSRRAPDSINQRVIYGAIALILFAIGISRIYLGAHWFSDVAAGYMLGAGMVAIVINIGRHWLDGVGNPQSTSVSTQAQAT